LLGEKLVGAYGEMIYLDERRVITPGACADLGGRVGASSLIAARYYHPGAQGGQARCDVQADASGPAGYEGRCTVQPVRHVRVRSGLDHGDLLGAVICGGVR